MRRTLLKPLALAAVAAAIPASVLANEKLMELVEEDEYWVMPNRDFGSTRYSELDQINAGNAPKLQAAWTFSTGVLRGHEGGPLVLPASATGLAHDTLYVTAPFPNNTFAINLDTLEVVWEYIPIQNQDETVPVMCCDTVTRGLAFGDGKIFLQQANTELVALDVKTGKKVWSVKNGEPKKGETNTNAPHVIKDKVFTGISGGEFGVRGFIAAYNIKDGKLAWKAYSVGPDAEMLIDPEKTTELGKPVGKDSSLKTWQGEQWKIGGGTTWGWYSYDPDLNLIYYGSGNPSTWNPVVRPGDNKWSMTIFARDVDTGVAKWVYQM
ncbi:MAG: PQQ-binding-like beta-propeller repeat protein, partial [Beggiatoa sp.]|nr:PQQ-binding-like beta-propeller repeat protein [Beggiatoa sp.]